MNITITDQALFDKMQAMAKSQDFGQAQPFIKDLWDLFTSWLHSGYRMEYSTLYQSYKKLCGHMPEESISFDDFFNPKLLDAMRKFFGEDETGEIIGECLMAMKAPYSLYIYRPSYRSSKAGDYAELFFHALTDSACRSCCGTPEELSRFSRRIALALGKGDPETVSAVESAILGDAGGDRLKFGTSIIEAIVMSSHRPSLELLGNLTLAAKNQEGLRQAVFERCDFGTIESHVYFMQLALDNGLCRFSSVIRAFDTWTGLDYGNQKQKVVEKMMALALSFLEDEAKAHSALDSPDTTEMYMGLWAMACRDIHSATGLALGLLESPEKYRRLLGWHFISSSNNEGFRHALASRYLHVRDAEELAWIVGNIKVNDAIKARMYHYSDSPETLEEDNAIKTFEDSCYPSTLQERSLLFDQALSAARFIGNKKTTFAGSVFPWVAMALDSKPLFGLMASLVGYDRNPELTMKFAGAIALCDQENRFSFYVRLLDPDNPTQREILLEGLSDKSPAIRAGIMDRLARYPLLPADVQMLEKSLTTANAHLRKAAIGLLSRLEGEMSKTAIESLLNGKSAQVLAGMELLEILSQKQPELAQAFGEKVACLRRQKPGEAFEAIAGRIYANGPVSPLKELTPENGFGLYDPTDDRFKPESWAGKLACAPIDDAKLKERLLLDPNEVIALYRRMEEFRHSNRDYEYETVEPNGERVKALLGNMISVICDADPNNPKGIYDYPLAERWLEAMGTHWQDPNKAAALMAVWKEIDTYRHEEYFDWYRSLFDGLPVLQEDSLVAAKIVETYDRPWDLYCFNNLIGKLAHGDGMFDFALEIHVSLISKIPQERLAEVCVVEPKPYPSTRYLTAWDTPYLDYWREIARNCIKTDEQFAAYFSQMWYLQLACPGSSFRIPEDDVLKAHSLGLISDAEVFRYMLEHWQDSMHLPIKALMDFRNASWYGLFTDLKRLLAKAIDAIVTVESQRGELATPLSDQVVFVGPYTTSTGQFVHMMSALGQGGFYRKGYFSSWTAPTRRESVSHLLQNSFPEEKADPAILKAELTAAGIPEARMLQAALFAPQWAGLLETALGIEGLKSGVWFFHAHANEEFSALKETEVAIFSSISPERFNDGAFDRDWFFETYNALGEKRFGELYANAKLISDSSISHRRSQLFTDAALGRMNKAQALAEIQEKRHLERLRAYAIIGLDPSNTNDALERYEYINRFAKESRQFGSARQASEGKAVAAALDNLAITAGYGDADRMSWALESQRTELLAPLMLPKAIGQAEVHLTIDGDGEAGVEVVKNGKRLKSMPKDLAKDEYVAELKAAAKSLKEQHSRARLKLELAMVARSVFASKEIVDLLNNPVLGKHVSRLVFADGDRLGFPVLEGGELCLCSFDGTVATGISGAIIAHPWDFIKNKCWSDYQRAIFESQTRQPFKQVFREYYPLTEDEMASGASSSRYEGHQVQPGKTVALLKTRGWTVDFYAGLQRVWHKENLVAHVYSMADWFSPSDIEAPTLQAIDFTHRRDGQCIPFADIPPVIFSETMRDLDLAVSVAHVGTVDPQASQSTIEMRVAIAEELVRLLGVGNVSFKSAHAIVAGQLGEYSVHMGSGIIHKTGTGMIAVLPVHSQHRMPTFLPFADDDTKTAEIMSKILLMSQDSRIKDPGILSQLKRS